MMILPGSFFHFFQSFHFSSCYWDKMAKWPKMTENSVTLHISGSIHMIVCVDTHVYNDHISRCSFHFFKIVIFDVAGSERAKNGPK